ncbi:MULTISPECIES: serine hydrolase domain-containing protein [Streptomyces]|uniref:Serine hydrolase domain-containing protein n=1 Tax=Streptomyces flaveolus TaxID=67297 RepID=A0ABV3AEX1_9ACTN|nr:MULTISPECIES: serine hydrolase domain-containing protein [Streptomyces]
MTTTVTDALRTRVRDRLTAAVNPRGRLGVQFYVSRHGEPLCDVAVGEFRPGETLTTAHRLRWMCVSKPVLVFVLARLHDRGELSTDTRVADVIPEFAAGGKQEVTVEHLLTHTAVFAQRDFKAWRMSRDAAVEFVCGWTLEDPAGTRAWYSGVAAWLVLSEVVRRVSGRDYFDLAREWVLDPLGMATTTDFGGAGEARPSGALFQRPENGPLMRIPEPPQATPWPGTEIWGPARELARLFECAVSGGVADGRRLFSPAAFEHFFTPCRTGLRDGYFSDLELDWSRGLCADPVLFGAPVGARVVGHTGYVTALALGDLDTGLVISYLSNTAVREPLLHTLENELVRDVYQAVGR